MAKAVGAKVPGPGSKVKRLKSLLERAEEKEVKLALLKVSDEHRWERLRVVDVCVRVDALKGRAEREENGKLE